MCVTVDNCLCFYKLTVTLKCSYKCYLNHRTTKDLKSSENVKIELLIACRHDKASDSSTSHSSDKSLSISDNETAEETSVSLSSSLSSSLPPHTGMCNFTYVYDHRM